jgi:hypothetical protein
MSYDSLEGRWQLDFLNGQPPHPGNEFILAGGDVVLPSSGQAVGRYDQDLGQLTVTLTMPAIAEEAAWQMVARFLVPDPAADHLLGLMVAEMSGDEPSISNPCAFVRRVPDA